MATYKDHFQQLPPIWANPEEIVEHIQKSNMRRNEKDFYFCELISKLLARVEILENCIDEIVAQEEK